MGFAPTVSSNSPFITRLASCPSRNPPTNSSDEPPFFRYQSAACKQRGAAYNARVEKLRRDAREKLIIGTNKEAVIHFFAENGIPLSFVGGEATGTISTTGCAPAGCG